MIERFRTLPFEEASNPIAIQKATLAGDIKFQRENFDQTTRDLLSKIFVQEPNLRASVETLKTNKFFATLVQQDPSANLNSMWKQVQQKKLNGGKVPFKPDQLDYQSMQTDQCVEVSNISPANNNNEEARFEKRKPEFLGNFTIYKVNREFQDF